MTVSDYDDLATLLREEAEPTRPKLAAALLELWANRYVARWNPTALLEFSFDGVTYLFDNASSVSAAQEDRAVGVVGLSRRQPDRRDLSYQRRSPRPTSREQPLDRGHLVPHTAGGALHVNLFPHDRALNRGWSEEGKAYRAMERRIAVPGTFFLCSLLYGDPSWTPTEIELGLVDGDRLEWRRFRNGG